MAITQPPPIVVTGPTVVIGDLQFGGATGGWPGGQAPLGGTFVVGPNGDVIVGDGYGGCASCGVFLITPAGVQSVIANFTNSNAAGVDQYGNAYIARDYGPSIIKLPYDAATGTYTGFTTLPTANCLGGTQDTAACVFAPGTQKLFAGENGGFTSLFFDGQGNFFFSTDTNPANNPDTIYECSAQCQAETDGNGTYPAVVVYADTSGGLGSVAIDPWGNLFFSDGADNGANTGKVSNLQELPFTAGHYAPSPTLMTSYTTTAGYNAITGVSANSLNTVFFTVANDGVFALPNSSSGPNAAGIYKVSGQGGQGLAVDSIGNLYTVGYVNALSHTGVTKTLLNSLSLGSSAVGTAATAATVTATDNAGNCTTPPSLVFTGVESGLTSTEFATVAGTTCSTTVGTGSGTFSPALASTGASYSATITFTPTKVGERNAALVITDSTNSASGTTALSGVGQGAENNLDPGVSTAYGSGFTTPYSVSVDAADDMAVADEGAGKVFWIPAGSPAGTAPTSIGSGFVEPSATAFDANGNLYIADFSNDNVVEIPNVSGALVPASQSTLIPATMVFDGTALSKPSGLAVGPNGTLYIADLGNSRVVSYNLVTGETAVPITGLKDPWGIAIDSSNNIYVADTGNGNVLVDVARAQSTLMVPGVTAPWGVALDPSGSLIVSDKATGNIVWVPNVSGTLTTANAVLIEKNPSSAFAIALDAAGNLFAPDATGKAVYAIQRTAAAINLGTVQDGVTNSGTVYLISAGNEAATLGSPDVTQSANTMFTLDPATNNGCSSASTTPPGASCQFTATFAPPVTTPPTTGLQSGAATINIATPALALSVNMSGTASQSAILAQTITFSPPASLEAGQQITLSATGGASGNPVTFSIDPSSPCTSCATTTGTTGATLTTVGAGKIIVDANQAAGTANGNQYAAAPQVQVTITINNVVPAGEPALFMTQTNSNFPAILTGGVLAGPISAGTSIGVGNNGYVAVSETYGGSVAIYNLAAGTVSSLGSFSNPGGIAADSKVNLYIAGQYNNTVVELPFVNGAYATLASPSSSTPNCTSSSTVECVLAPITGVSAIGGIGAITFDSQGNLYLATDNNGTTQFSIWECTAACLSTGTPAPTMLFQEPAGSNPVTTGQLYVGSLGVDPWGNLFFTDSNFINQAVSSPNNEATLSDVYELPFTAGKGFATTPVLLQTYTDGTPGGYDDNLDALAVAPNGTVYYATLYDGVFAIPNTQTGGPKIADQYPVSNSGAKVLGVDASGNLYEVSSALSQILIGDLTTPNAQFDGTPVSASATIVDNAFGCGTTANLVIASSNSQFSAKAGTNCTGISAGGGFTAQTNASTYPATINFTATQPAAQSATLTVSDTTNGGVGTATVTGFALTTPQTITFTAPTTTTYTYSPGMTITVSVTNGGSNNPVVFNVDSTSKGTGTFSSTTVTGTTSSATLTVTQAGSIVIDANESGGLANGTYYDAAPQIQLALTINPAAQAIVFPQPNSPVTFASNPSTTVTLSANGGVSGNPVVFTVDTTSTGAGSISTSTVSNGTSTATLTVTGAGNIVIDATQAGNADYAAAAQVQQTIVVNQAAQTIAFVPLTQPFYYIVTGAKLSIQATGGGSDQAIVFTLDKSSTMSGTFSASTVSGATSTTTLTMPANQSPTSGTIVIDANQTGNTNYLAATQTQMTITVLAPLPTQSITFPLPQTQVGGTTLTLTATASSGLPIAYSSSTTSVCTVSGPVATFASVNSASTCTITASQPGDNQTFAAASSVTVSFSVNPQGETPAMNLSISLPSLTIEPGTVGVTQVTVTSQNNFIGSVAFACSGLPSGYSCSFNPNPLNVAEGGTTTTTLTVTPPSTAALIHRNFTPIFPATLAVAFCFLGFEKRKRLQLFLLLVVLFAGLGLISACGGTSSSSTPAPVTSNITITATSGSIQVSSTMSITLE
jgi:sugar lactone lactonase YvrE